MINYQMAHCPISCPFFRPIQSHQNLISSKSASIFLFYSIASSVSLHNSMFWISVPVEDPASFNVLYSFGAKVGWFKEFPTIIGTVWCDSPKFLLRKKGAKNTAQGVFHQPLSSKWTTKEAKQKCTRPYQRKQLGRHGIQFDYLLVQYRYGAGTL